jgi:hypothetical protein
VLPFRRRSLSAGVALVVLGVLLPLPLLALPAVGAVGVLEAPAVDLAVEAPAVEVVGVGVETSTLGLKAGEISLRKT